MRQPCGFLLIVCVCALTLRKSRVLRMRLNVHQFCLVTNANCRPSSPANPHRPVLAYERVQYQHTNSNSVPILRINIFLLSLTHWVAEIARNWMCNLVVAFLSKWPAIRKYSVGLLCGSCEFLISQSLFIHLSSFDTVATATRRLFVRDSAAINCIWLWPPYNINFYPAHDCMDRNQGSGFCASNYVWFSLITLSPHTTPFIALGAVLLKVVCVVGALRESCDNIIEQSAFVVYRIKL